MSNKRFLIIWVPIISIILTLTISINIAMNIFSGYVDLYLGTGDIVITKSEGSEDWDANYYPIDYESTDSLNEAADLLVQEIMGEGSVLMKNNGALPLSVGNVTLLGRGAADPVYGGSGSGSVDLTEVVDLRTGMEAAGFTINDTVYSILSEFAAYSDDGSIMGSKRVYENPRANIVMDKPEESSYYIGEMPVEQYTADAISSFANYNDAAVVVISRAGGEGGDLTMDMSLWDENYHDTQHQLELNQDEKDVIELAKENFDKVIVLVNSSSAMELGILEDDADIDAVLWIGSPGQSGFYAVGEILAGTINPSGHTADIYPADFTKDPTYVNFGHFQYDNISSSNASGNGYFVQYEEGIYIGYRYYETAAVEGYINYDEAVVYPFGYGLSYTDFSFEIVGQELGQVDGTIAVDVKVTNTGSVAGKDAVQLYYSAPYTPGGIEKSSVVLGDFAKTGLLEPGASETVTLTMPVSAMAAYDYKVNRAYVLEEGDYELRIQTDSHTIAEGCEPIVYSVNSTVVFSEENSRPGDEVTATNLFDDLNAAFSDSAEEGMIQNLSRADFAGTFPTAPTGADFSASEATIEGFQVYSASDNISADDVAVTTNADNGLNLIDLRTLSYDDPTWELLLDQLSISDMEELVLNGAYNTIALTKVGKPATVDFDGPAGISSFMTDISCTAYPSQVVIASTFNKDLSYDMGVMVGNEGLDNGINGWYAPGLNIHRNQFAGRNFEYYSEDPLLSGHIGTAVVEGAASKGMYTCIKHFAVNDQEGNRVNNGIASWVNEQALREIYLRPFELVVKNSTKLVPYIADDEGTRAEMEMPAATALMSSFNRVGGVWAGGSTALMTDVLRDEWGFEGMVITDFNLYGYMYPDQGIAAGSDLMLTFESMKTLEDTDTPTAEQNLRTATKNILFNVANSNAMNGAAPGSIITYTEAPWRSWVMYGNIAIGILLAAAIAWVFIRVKKHKAQ